MLPKLIFLSQPSIEMLIAENFFSGAASVSGSDENNSDTVVDGVISVDHNKLKRALNQQFSELSTRHRRRLDRSSSISVIFLANS